jgi:hypothetical protein
MSHSDTNTGESTDAVERRLRRLEELVEQQADRITHLENKLEAERERREALITARGVDPADADLGAIFIAGRAAGSMLEGALDRQDRFDERFGAVRDDISTERDQRGREDAKLRRRVAAVAEKAGVDVTDADLLGDDKIQRVLKHGVDDVEESPTITAYRARDLLENISSWGRTIDDANGTRVAVTSPTARDRFADARDEELRTSQVKRVFRKIEEWGSSSPRHVDADCSGETNRLVISLEDSD